MPKFIYQAKKSPTEIIDGVLEAENLEGAVEKIIKLGLSPIDVAADTRKERPVAKKAKDLSFSFSARIRFSDVSLFLRQLGDMVDAGVPLLRALSVVVNQTHNPAFKDVIAKMQAYVQDGGMLSEAMAQHPQAFSSLYINMVKSGEMSGNLDVVLKRLAEFSEKDLETQAKVKSSLVYPALIMVVGALTIFVLLTFVVPRVTVMFEDMTETLPLPTVILIVVSNFFAKFWWFLIALGVLGIFYMKRFLGTADGKLRFDRMRLKIPVLGNFIREAEIGRFARTLSTLLESGVVISTALESVWAVLDNEVLRREIKKASEDVSGGDSLAQALKKCPSFPETAINMVAVGEEAGRLEDSLAKLADAYERQSDRSVKTVTTLLEPLMIVVVGAIVFFIVMAVVLPIFKMNQAIK